MANEPLITIGTLTALIGALLTLLKAFGVPVTEDQQAAINQIVAIVAPILVAVIARRYTTPLSNPKDEDGVSLVRGGTGDPTKAQTRKATRALAK